MSPSSGICPCDIFVFPQPISNLPEQTSILYRVGDFVSFRRSLLLSRPGETELVNWRPGAQGDLAVQMIEWWAYLADILTFYNQCIANQDYLLTADLPESVGNLIRILGYRPRPGIGATGIVAATMSGAKSFTLPQGFPIQSKPGPGNQPQIFELGTATLIALPDAIAADPVTTGELLGADGASVLVKGAVTAARSGDQLLLLAAAWTGIDATSGPDLRHAVVTVQSVAPEKDPRGSTNTRITFTAPPTLPAGAQAAGYQLLRSTQSTVVWQYPAETVIQSDAVDLAAIARNIQPGDPVLFSLPGVSPAQQLVSVISYTEAVWYANPSGLDPTKPPGGSPSEVGIPIPHSHLGFQPPLTGFKDTPVLRAAARVRFGWQPLGQVIATPATSLTGTQLALDTPLPSPLLPMTNQDVLVSDANGNGVEAQATAGASSPTTLGLSNVTGSADVLSAPFNVLFNLLAVSRGKSVSNEILGSGDSTITAGQEFTLQRSPLTYLPGASAASGDDYHSTLQIWVDGVEWTEVPSFYGQPADARVFVTSEDNQNITHVQFGDGVNGARVPTGVNNVIASYRYGSGGRAPDPGSLTVILQPWPGLKAILNPVAAGGGADPDQPQQIKTLAPRSVLTFGRAISFDDYETIAAQAPGVARARAYWTWDRAQQRNMVKVYVGDNAAAVASANVALAGASDPNRPLQVTAATAIPVSVSFTVVISAAYQPAGVLPAVTAAVTDPDAGVLGANVVQIGQSIYQSQVFAACLAVPGVVAVHDLEIARKPVLSFRRGAVLTRTPRCSVSCSRDFRFDPGEGNFFQLAPSDLTIGPQEVNGNAG